jgi:hypothetical protein
MMLWKSWTSYQEKIPKTRVFQQDKKASPSAPLIETPVPAQVMDPSSRLLACVKKTSYLKSKSDAKAIQIKAGKKKADSGTPWS